MWLRNLLTTTLGADNFAQILESTFIQCYPSRSDFKMDTLDLDLLTGLVLWIDQLGYFWYRTTILKLSKIFVNDYVIVGGGNRSWRESLESLITGLLRCFGFVRIEIFS